MSAIRCIYEKEPKFPATDQHPDAVRYYVSGKVVDAIGGEPTAAEIDAVLNPLPPEKSLVNLVKKLEGLGLTLDELKEALK